MAPSDEETSDIHGKTAPIFEAIGYVAHHWARLEHSINQTIWALSAITPEDGACITSQIVSILPRMRALIALADRNGCSKKLIGELNTFSAEADRLGRRRNRVVHDPWFFREAATEKGTMVEYGRLEITADRRLVYEIKPQSRKEVLEIAHKVIGAHEKFQDLRDRIHAELKEHIESRLGTSLESYLNPSTPEDDKK